MFWSFIFAFGVSALFLFFVAMVVINAIPIIRAINEAHDPLYAHREDFLAWELELISR